MITFLNKRKYLVLIYIVLIYTFRCFLIYHYNNMSNNLPKYIKYRTCKKYTEKRNPYKSYLGANWKWSDIFNEIDNLKKNTNNFIKHVSTKYGIKYSTLCNKYNYYNKYLRSDAIINVNEENRGGCNKIFSDVEEKQLFERIKSDYIDNNKPLNNNIIKEMASDFFKKYYPDGEFKLSIGWCTKFKKDGV